MSGLLPPSLAHMEVLALSAPTPPSSTLTCSYTMRDARTPSGAVYVYEEPLRSSIHGVLVLRRINIRLTAVFMALNLDGFVLSLDTTQEDVSRLKKLFLS